MVGGSAGVGGVDGGGQIVETSTVLPEWLTQLGPLGVVGLIGVFAGSFVTHRLTTRRERVKWLRELQVKANQDFYSAAQAFMDYVIDGYVKQPLTPPGAIEGTEGDEIAKLRTACNKAGLNLLPVARESTLQVASKATRLLPTLAYLSVPLSMTHHQAAQEQRSAAIKEMSKLLENVGAVMRSDLGLTRWRQRRAIKEARDSIMNMKLECDVTSAEPAEMLRAWGVLSPTQDEVPTAIEQYRVATFPGNVAQSPQPQAFAAKFRDRPWQFGIVEGVHHTIESAILEDVVRLITGHIHGYDMVHKPEIAQLIDTEGGNVPGVGLYWREIKATDEKTPPPRKSRFLCRRSNKDGAETEEADATNPQPETDPAKACP